MHERTFVRAAVMAFAAILATCAVWAQTVSGSGVADRPGSGPLTALGAGPTLVPIETPRLETVAAHVVIVQPGDTLWAIARRVRPHGDVRPLVDRLEHQLRGGSLSVGERLQLP